MNSPSKSPSKFSKPKVLSNSKIIDPSLKSIENPQYTYANPSGVIYQNNSYATNEIKTISMQNIPVRQSFYQLSVPVKTVQMQCVPVSIHSTPILSPIQMSPVKSQIVYSPVKSQIVYSPVKTQIIPQPSQIIHEQNTEVIDNKRIKQLEEHINNLLNENMKLRMTLEDWRNKLIQFEQNEIYMKEKLKKSINRESQIIERRIEVPIEKIKRVEVPIEIIKRIEVPIEKIIEKRVEIKVPYPVEKIVEKIIEKPIEIIKYDTKRVYELEEDNNRLRKILEEWRYKLLSYEENEINMREKIKKHIEPIIVERERIIEKPIEIIKIDNQRVNELENEITKLRITLEDWRIKLINYERAEPKIIEKRVEVPIEIIKEKIIYDDRKIRELEREKNDFYSEINSLKIIIEEWKSKFHRLEMIGPKTIEIPREIIKFDDNKIRELEIQIISINKELEDWKFKYFELEKRYYESRNLKNSEYIEIDNQWKLKYFELERVYEELKNDNLGLINSQIYKERTINNSNFIDTRIFEQNLNILTEEKKDLESRIDWLTHENEKLVFQLNESNEEINRFKSEAQFYVNNYDTQNRIAILSSEIQRLNILNSQYQREIDDWRLKFSNYKTY